MRLSDLGKQGIARVRKPDWDKKVFMELTLWPSVDCYVVGAWAKFYDRERQQELGVPTPQSKYVLTDKDDDWEEDTCGSIL